MPSHCTGWTNDRTPPSIARCRTCPRPYDTRFNHYLLLGGDLNTLASAPAGSRYLAKDQGVLDRITGGFGLKDLLQSSLQKNDPDRGRLAGCECSFGDDCKHTWTYRKGKVSKGRYQDDYLFASAALEERGGDRASIAEISRQQREIEELLLGPSRVPNS